jgi:acetylglutamate kinase
MSGQLVVVKLGGELLETPERLAEVTNGLAAMATDGPLVVVHGGGREIDAELRRRGITTQAVDGLRITDAPTLDAVVAVLAGTINTRLVAALVTRGVQAVGLTGVDGALARATRVPLHRAVDGREVDLGLVGTPEVDPTSTLLVDLVAQGHVPVVASLGVDAHGQVLNVNADTAAAALAVALGATKLVVLTDVEGLYENWPDVDSLVRRIGADRLAEMLPRLQSGMVPKMEACLRAVRGGVPQAHVIDGRQPHSILLEIFTSGGVGTMVVPALTAERQE